MGLIFTCLLCRFSCCLSRCHVGRARDEFVVFVLRERFSGSKSFVQVVVEANLSVVFV